MHALMTRFPREGQLRWIGLRPARDVPMREVPSAEARTGAGLVGDRYAGGSGKRGVTLIQAEHLPAILRRNLVVSGIALVALRGQRFRVGGVLLEGTDSCDPCSRMEQALGPGGYNALRGMGGLCARVLEGGTLRIGDAVAWVGA